MGAIHIGHAFLIKKCNSLCDKTIVTIFVNKPQFNNKKDFRKYPKKLIADINKLKKLKVDYLFTPSEKDIYPSGINNNIKIDSFSKKLCGSFRPGHFKAVVDVIDRFIKIINPSKIFLGEKDMQQLKLIENFVRINHKKIKIIPCKTIREKNGLACSSRNLLLTKKEKIIASKLYNKLKTNKNELVKNNFLLISFKKKLLNLGVKKIEYLKILDINKIIQPFVKKKKYKIFISYFLGKVRLIDNI